jgi:demethoxyubiquinone hydroxylase (CLK1/Coq7/Cat5 family)
MGVKLICDNSHNTVGKFGKSQAPQKNDDAPDGKETPDVSSNDNAIKTGVIKFDIFGELIYKSVIHGFFLF